MTQDDHQLLQEITLLGDAIAACEEDDWSTLVELGLLDQDLDGHPFSSQKEPGDGRLLPDRTAP